MYLILQILFISNSLLGQEEKRVGFGLCELRIIESWISEIYVTRIASVEHRYRLYYWHVIGWSSVYIKANQINR